MTGERLKLEPNDSRGGEEAKFPGKMTFGGVERRDDTVQPSEHSSTHEWHFGLGAALMANADLVPCAVSLSLHIPGWDAQSSNRSHK